MNLLLVLMDDMRHDELAYMPQTRQLLERTGTTFSQCRCNVPLCSPARAGILTGQLSKHHGVLTNINNPDSNEYNNSTFVALDNAGYRVGMVGKFFTNLAGGAVKPGFDFWRALQNVTPYGIYDPSSYGIYNGTTTTEPSDYQEHYLLSQALTFIGGAEPWCLWYNPTAPHWPYDNPPDHTRNWAGRDFPLTLESSVADKPSWIQALPVPAAAELAELQAEQRVRLRELRSVDESIAAMVAAAPSDTTVFFCSDNGAMLAEHRIIGPSGARAAYKNLPYDPSMKVPLVVAGPDFDHQTVSVPTMQQDIVATMLDLADATPLLGNQAGTSLAAIATSPASYSSRQLLAYRDGDADDLGVPTADILWNAQYKYVRYQGETEPDERELYDLLADPDELTNIAYDNGAGEAMAGTMNAALNAALA